MSIKKDFGSRIKELRMKKGITQFELAEMVNVDPKHISHVETGKSFPKADLIEKLANALNIQYREFFKTEHFQNRESKIEEINSILNDISDKDLNVIYRMIISFVN